jgi:2,5-diamino-6-(ribosylamino)-4(3H)-pyrimidinone 5'-phosphate reductase
MTLDGKIATFTGDSGISSERDLKRVHKLRSTVDVILVGINTVLVDDPMLSARRVKGKNPMRVIVDSSARISLNSRIMRSCKKIPTLIATSEKASKARLQRIIVKGAHVMIVGKKKVDLAKLLFMLQDRGVRKLLVEGGGEINWSMLNNDLVDELIVTIAPRIIGGRDAITLVEGEGYAMTSRGVKLKLNKIKNVEGEVILFYKV